MLADVLVADPIRPRHASSGHGQLLLSLYRLGYQVDARGVLGTVGRARLDRPATFTGVVRAGPARDVLAETEAH